MIYDFHSHTLLSDGVLSPIEQIRRASLAGYGAIGLTDHAGLGYLDRVVKEIVRDCAVARAHWDIIAIPGIELTHLPPAAIPEAAKKAKDLGAWLVVVHGETSAEPVEPGTNLAALRSPDVDILAHPGLITPEEAALAAHNGVFLELSARKGHCLTNGHVAKMARQAGAKLLIDSDAHDPGDLLTPALVNAVGRGSALDEDETQQVLLTNALALMERLKPFLQGQS